MILEQRHCQDVDMNIPYGEQPPRTIHRKKPGDLNSVPAEARGVCGIESSRMASVTFSAQVLR
jgi:hypothetical protein